jgi:hypothetical protein
MLNPGRHRASSAILAIGCLALLGACSGTTAGTASNGPATTVTKTVSDEQAPTTITATMTVTETVPSTYSSSPEPESDSDSPPSGLTIGATSGITVTTDEGAAEVRVLSVKRETKSLGSYGDAPQNGTYVLVDVEYVVTSGTFDYNPFDWNVRDSEGHTFDGAAGSMSGYEGNTLRSGTIAKGSKARGIVVFDAPKGPLSLEYSQGFGAPASWAIPG